MKKKIYIILVTLLLTGCTLIKQDPSPEVLENIVTTVLSQKTNLYNTSYVGYNIYIPKDVAIINKTDFNSTFKSKDDRYYLYTDVVSYYHKSDNTYKENKDAYYSKKFVVDNKDGFIEVNKLKDKYFVEIVYNYSKIEAYIQEENLNKSITEMLIILKGIKYKDPVIKTLIGEINLKTSEERINIFESVGADENYLEIIETLGDYQDVDDELPDPDKISLKD